jgi:copper(I)-binding protein
MDPESNESEPIPDGNPECRLDLALLGVWLAASSLTVSAHEMRLKALNIVHPFVFETEQSEAALHVRIKNTGSASERLLGASTPLASKVSIVDDAGRAAGGLVIPARGELSLKSASPRIVLSGLAKPLRAYDSFNLTLVFEKAGPVKVEVVVEEKADPPGAG